MLKNVKLKKILKKTIFPIISVINKIIPKRDDFILLYSPNWGIDFNLKPVRDYLFLHDYDKKYKIICGIENMKYADKDNAKYVTQFCSIFYFLISRHIFYTTGQIPIKPSKQQKVIQMWHGAALFKTIGALSKINNGYEFYFTYFTIPSKIYSPIIQKAFHCKEKNIAINGEPMTDVMLTNTRHYNLGNFKKIIMWTPTFRSSDYLGYSDSSEELLPMFTKDDYENLNSILKKYNYKLIVKLHSAQNLKDDEISHFSNLDIYSDIKFKNAGYELYKLLPQTDVLLADYSSVFLQYLLLDKPIGFVVPDMEEYKKRRGFVFKVPEKYMPGPIIKSKEQLYNFFDELGTGIDEYKEKRDKVKQIIHTYQDANNSRRVLELSEIY